MEKLQVTAPDCAVDQVEQIRTQIEQLIGHIEAEKEELLSDLWNGLLRDMESCSSAGVPFDYECSVYSGLLEGEIDRLNGYQGRDAYEVLADLERIIEMECHNG